MKKLMLLTMLITSTAQAEFLTGNMLLQRMQSASNTENMVALGYVMGVFDTKHSVNHCPSSNVSTGQARDVVKQFLESYPSVRDHTADMLVQVALAAAWPCKDKKNGGV